MEFSSLDGSLAEDQLSSFMEMALFNEKCIKKIYFYFSRCFGEFFKHFLFSSFWRGGGAWETGILQAFP